MNKAMLLTASLLMLPAAVAACGGASSATAAHSTIIVGQQQAGQTVEARVGDTVRVKLQEKFPVPGSALVWDVSSSAPTVLRPDRVTRDPAERPRVGDVAYTADFVATRGGQADLIARGSQTCEAMTGPGCQNQDFTITVVVS